MKRNIARHIWLAKLAALALLTFCFVQLPVGARAIATAADPMPLPLSDHRDGPKFPDVIIGFAFGQTLRLTVAHVGGQAGQDQPPPDVRAGVWLLDASGRVIAQSAQVRIPRNEFHSFDFNRAAINLPGEPGTGRLQVRARLVVSVAEPYCFTTDPKPTGLLTPTLEIVDNSTGRTATANNLKQIGLAIHVVSDSGL